MRNFRFYKIFFTIIIFAISGKMNAQIPVPFEEKKYVDSLNNEISLKKDDLSVVNAHFLLSEYYTTTQPKVAQSHIESAKKYISKSPLIKAKYLFYEGKEVALTDKNKALKNYEEAISILEKINTEESKGLQANIWYFLGIIKKDPEGYPFVIKILTEKSIPLAEASKKASKIGHYYSQLGIVMTYNAEFQKAEKYHDKAISFLEKNAPNSPELLIAYLNKVSNLVYQAKADEAKIPLDKAENLIKDYPNSQLYPLFLYGKMLWQDTKEYNEEATITANEGIEKAQNLKQARLLQMFYFNKYSLYRQSGKLGEAKTLLLSVLADKTLITDLNNRKTVFNELSTLSEQMGDDKDALLWSRQYSKLSDSLHTSKIKLEINSLETQFRTAEKEKQLVVQKLEINKKNQYMWILGFSALLFLILGALAYFYYKNKKKIAEQREINLQQKLREKEQTEELKVTKAILDGEERERERVAKDLHDGLGGMLAGVKINLSTWSSNNLENNQLEDFQKILNQLDKSVSELRRVARNLMPESLLNFGLEVALKDLCEFYMKDGLLIDFQSINLKNDLPLSMQVNIYRIIQELLNNAVKHSNADNILVQCSQSDEEFYITVEDNGKGIAEAEMNKTKSLGFKNIQNRVNFLKGKMEIQSTQNQGTSINIEINTNAA